MWMKYVVLSVFLTAMALFAFPLMTGCGGGETSADVAPEVVQTGDAAPDAGAEAPADSVSVAKASTGGIPRLVDLGAKACIPCKMMAPVLEELTREYAGKMEVIFIDVWMEENKAVAEAYGVTSIPTQIFYDGEGRELWRHVGFLSKEDILSKWQALGFDFL